MILVCPSCDTRYFADDAALGQEGRRVRCTSCGHAWFAKPQEEGGLAVAEATGLTRDQVERLRQTAAANAAARTGPHSEYRAKELARRHRNRAVATVIAWSLAFVIFAGAVTVAVAFRDEVANAWPKTASLYKMVGLDVNRFGLTLEEVAGKRSFEGTTPVLTVTGLAVNAGGRAQKAPDIRISLRDETGKEVHHWSDKLDVAEIEPGGRVPFSTQIVAPPIETYNVEVTFEPSLRLAEDDHAGAPALEAHGASAPEMEAAHDASAGGEAADAHETDEHQADEHQVGAGASEHATDPAGEADHH
ncbi:MAG: DUF3426 domain-containing protein [Hyphomonadaceae bacterium]